MVLTISQLMFMFYSFLRTESDWRTTCFQRGRNVGGVVMVARKRRTAVVYSGFLLSFENPLKWTMKSNVADVVKYVSEKCG